MLLIHKGNILSSLAYMLRKGEDFKIKCVY